jgi:hypothetical protein
VVDFRSILAWVAPSRLDRRCGVGIRGRVRRDRWARPEDRESGVDRRAKFGKAKRSADERSGRSDCPDTFERQEDIRTDPGPTERADHDAHRRKFWHVRWSCRILT